jgi:glycosyltransferase involved in cell wall biosynthesis
VLAQDYPAVEHVVVDDGSTDETPQILQRRSPDLAYWTSQPNAGGAAALNRAVEHAKGEFVLWLDADDVLLPGAVSRLATALDAEPDLVLVYGSCTLIDEQSAPLGDLPALEWDIDRFARLVEQPFLPGAALWRRHAWADAGPLNVDLYSMFDTEFFLRLGTLGRVRRLPEPLLAYRQHPKSLRYTQFGRRADEFLVFAQDVYRDLRVPGSTRRQARAILYRRAALAAYAGLDLPRARRLFLRSLLFSPRGLQRKQLSRLARAFAPAPLVRRRRQGLDRR